MQGLLFRFHQWKIKKLCFWWDFDRTWFSFQLERGGEQCRVLQTNRKTWNKEANEHNIFNRGKRASMRWQSKQVQLPFPRFHLQLNNLCKHVSWWIIRLSSEQHRLKVFMFRFFISFGSQQGWWSYNEQLLPIRVNEDHEVYPLRSCLRRGGVRVSWVN